MSERVRLPAKGRTLPGVAATLHRQWLSASDAAALIAALRIGIQWEQHSIKLFGRSVPSPRLSCWIGDPGASYAYSRTRFEPRPWPEPLLGLRSLLQLECGGLFNSVLANWYRNGSDSMGWHADNEPELGHMPMIASISLGADRRFLMRRKDNPRERIDLLLQHGDLLLMHGDTQQHWQHAVPKARAVDGDRINLTFRYIHLAKNILP